MNRSYPQLNLATVSHQFARRVSLLAVLAILLTAGCDSTSSDIVAKTAPVPEPTVNTGQFIDSAVIGIGFRTQTQSGETNSNGEFTYLNNEVVTFFIGDIELPAAPAKPVMSPVDLVRAAYPGENIDTSDFRVLNIARLLQSLDFDRIATNGLQIPELGSLSQGLTVDFASAGFDDMVANLILNSPSDPEVPPEEKGTLISAERARAHLEVELSIMPPDRDGDTVPDYLDAFPDDSSESVDSDGDGVGDNGDFAPNDPAIQSICQTSATDEEKDAAGCSNEVPVAVAGEDQPVALLAEVLLDGSASFDPEGNTLTYLWQIISGPENNIASFDDATLAQPIFLVGDLEGEFILQLTVDDGFHTGSDRVIITVDKSLAPSAAMFAVALLGLVLLNVYKRRKHSPRIHA